MASGDLKTRVNDLDQHEFEGEVFVKLSDVEDAFSGLVGDIEDIVNDAKDDLEGASAEFPDGFKDCLDTLKDLSNRLY